MGDLWQQQFRYAVASCPDMLCAVAEAMSCHEAALR